MTIDEKLEFLEKILHEPKYSLQEDTILNTLYGWESFNIVNLQIELLARGINVEYTELMKCDTIKDVCDLFN